MAPFPSPTLKWHDKAYQSILPTRPELSAKGKNVLVVGGGASAVEALEFACDNGAASVKVLARVCHLKAAQRFNSVLI